MFLNRYYQNKNKHLWLWQRIIFDVITTTKRDPLLLLCYYRWKWYLCELCTASYMSYIQPGNTTLTSSLRNRTIHCTRSKMTSCHMKNVQCTLKIPSVKYLSRLLVLFYLFTLSLIDGRSLIQSGNGGTFSTIKSCYVMRLLFQNSIYSSRIPKLLTYFSGKTTTAT